jgi:hypothetical protein
MNQRSSTLLARRHVAEGMEPAITIAIADVTMARIAVSARSPVK